MSTTTTFRRGPGRPSNKELAARAAAQAATQGVTSPAPKANGDFQPTMDDFKTLMGEINRLKAENASLAAQQALAPQPAQPAFSIHVNNGNGITIRHGQHTHNMWILDWEAIKANFSEIDRWVEANRAVLKLPPQRIYGGYRR